MNNEITELADLAARLEELKAKCRELNINVGKRRDEIRERIYEESHGWSQAQDKSIKTEALIKTYRREMAARDQSVSPKLNALFAEWSKLSEDYDSVSEQLESLKQTAENSLLILGSRRAEELLVTYEKLTRKIAKTVRKFSVSDDEAMSIAKCFTVCQKLHERSGEWRYGGSVEGNIRRLVEELKQPIQSTEE